MNPKHFARAAATALVAIILFMAGLEYYWRSKGYPLSYNDDKILWAHVRRQAYLPADRATVFVGSSRIKWDIDIDTWEKMTGEKAVQLALVGTSARKIVFDLANDEKFTGKLVIDVTGIFRVDPGADYLSGDALEYYNNETPAQRASALLDFEVESKFVFLEEGKFGLANLLKDESQGNRPGVRNPALPILKEYAYSTYARQSKFSPAFVNSPEMQQDQINRWEERGRATAALIKVAKGEQLDSLCNAYKMALDKIRARGGTVLFVALPISGNYLALEQKLFPRAQFYDRLLQATNTPGIHFSDYPATAGLNPLEGSHLSPVDAVKLTTSLVQTLGKEYGWKFPSTHP